MCDSLLLICEAFAKALGMSKKWISTTYHPQMHGQADYFHQIFLSMMRAFVDKYHADLRAFCFLYYMHTIAQVIHQLDMRRICFTLGGPLGIFISFICCQRQRVPYPSMACFNPRAITKDSHQLGVSLSCHDSSIQRELYAHQYVLAKAPER